MVQSKKTLKIKSPKRIRKRRQRGGKVSLPSEYFGKNSGRYFSTGSVELENFMSAYGQTNGKSRPYGNQAPGPHSSNQQTGGMFNYIINPESGRRVNIRGRIGKRILKKYLSKLYK